MREVPLTKGRVALIDDADLALIEGYAWKFFPRPGGVKGYAVGTRRGGGKCMVSMHRLILGAGLGQQVDHANGNGVDNRRSNLRFCTQSQNAANAIRSRRSKAGFKNVILLPNGLYQPCVEINCVRYRAGPVADLMLAARQADAILRVAHGDFARLNLPDEASVPVPPLVWNGYRDRPADHMRPYLVDQDRYDRRTQLRQQYAARAAAEAVRHRKAGERRAELLRVNAAVLKRLPSRDGEIIRRRLAGETLAVIGADHGLTRERVRQIVAASPRWGVRLEIEAA